MENVTVVMLGHKSLAGKDTIYSFAKELGFKRVAFADSLKYACMDLFDLTEDQVFGSSKDVMDKRYPNTRDCEWIFYDDGSEAENPDYKPFLTPRRILQLFGQDCRSLFPDIWASYIFNRTIPKLAAQGYNKIMVTDFRFKNEASVAQQWANTTGNKLFMFKVHRPGVVAKTGAGDISENDLNDFGCWSGEIVNDGDLESLRSKTQQIFSSI
jgi:hypothetical protein